MNEFIWVDLAFYLHFYLIVMVYLFILSILSFIKSQNEFGFGG